MGRVAPWVNCATHEFNARLVKHPADSFMVNCLLAQGVVIPVVFAACAHWTLRSGVLSPALCFAYHVLRIGPYFMQFAYYYTLCHKEGHTVRGFFAVDGPWDFAFNWWCALFFGVMPAAFAFGHGNGAPCCRL